jgi:hypothetical protein
VRDFAGDVRPALTAADMGAYEMQALVGAYMPLLMRDG